jgi:hypothetical protein
MLVQTAEKARWAPLKLSSIMGLKFLYRFDFTDDLQALVMSIKIEPGTWTLKYGMSRSDLGSDWHDDNKAEQRLKAFAEAELRKDLFLFHRLKKLPLALSRTVWLNSRGKAIPAPPRMGQPLII